MANENKGKGEQPEVKEAPAATVPTVAVVAAGNRFDRLFRVTFHSADRAKVYTSDRDSSSSKKIANVLLEVLAADGNGTGGYLHGSIYARKANPKAPAEAEFSFVGTQGQPGFTADGEQAKRELKEYRDILGSRGAAWWKANAATITTSAKPESVLEGMEF